MKAMRRVALLCLVVGALVGGFDASIAQAEPVYWCPPGQQGVVVDVDDTAPEPININTGDDLCFS